MAVTVFARYPGLSPQLYDEVVATLDLDANPPIGAILHLVGEAQDGLQVTEIWRTEQAFQAFHDRFLQALQFRGYLRCRPSRSRRSTTSSPSRWRRSSGWARCRCPPRTRVRRSRSAAPSRIGVSSASRRSPRSGPGS